MYDRVSKYPGRVKLTPVSGQTNVYDMVLVDEPATEGTKLNKANILSDATASVMGLTSSATPNDAFAKLRSLITTAQNTAESAPKIQVGIYDGDGTIGTGGKAAYQTIRLDFTPKAVLIIRRSSRPFYDYWTTTGGLALKDYPLVYYQDINAIEIVTNGFRVADYARNSDTNEQCLLNSTGSQYFYIAINY